MELLGARFVDARAAATALREIRSRVAVGPSDVATHPLGSTRYEAPSADVILAGRFEQADAPTVVEIVRRHGGIIVTRRVEWHETDHNRSGPLDQFSLRPWRSRPGRRIVTRPH